jgi:cytochrome c oxidase subunit 2
VSAARERAAVERVAPARALARFPAQEGSPTVSSPTSPGPRRRRTGGRLAAVLGVVALLTSGCDLSDAYEKTLYFGIPRPITDQAKNIHDLYLGSNAAAIIVASFVYALILFSALRYRRRGDELPRQVRYNLPIEILYTLIPFVIIAVLFYYTVVSENYVNKLSPVAKGSAAQASSRTDPVVNIGVVGFQWNWQFNYTDSNVQVTGEPGRPAQLVLPTDRVIRFDETSPDVNHSFWVPAFLFKRDVIPGRKNTFEITLRKQGTFIGHCAEFCGEKHAYMDFSVKVVSPQDYDTYISGLKADPNAAILTASAGSSS